MTHKNLKTHKIETTSYIWHSLLLENQINIDGIIVEVAPGHEPKIGNALALLGFKGTIFLIEPDRKTACLIQKTYREILPQAMVKKVVKPLQDVEVGVDVPGNIDALVASHPFDDMVLSCIVNDPFLFSREREDRKSLSNLTKKLYDGTSDEDYQRGVKTTVKTWKDFVKRSRPNYFIASQYPSYTLEKKGLTQRQNSGFAVLEKLKSFYKNSLLEQHQNISFGYKSELKWWIIAENPHADLAYNLEQRPLAIKRLGKSVFVSQQVRKMHPEEYNVVYVNNEYFNNSNFKQVEDLALAIDDKKTFSRETILAYSDRQKDRTDIGLSGNCGSGRAVYYGDKFNILGVGKTTLCKSTVPSHSTGRLELVGAMRRVILSKWINYFIQRASTHPALIVLKETARFKWNSNPVPLSLLVRIDNASLDRPSHVEYYPKIHIDFKKTLIEYAKLDAEYFAYRIIFGAWSTSNYSLAGHMIDLESTSFVKYRGPYHTSSDKYPDNLFGYEGFGFLKILHQLASIKNVDGDEIDSSFYSVRNQHLAHCFLLLIGVQENLAPRLLSKYKSNIFRLSSQFESLAKKIAFPVSLNLYMPTPDDKDPSLLDMSNLFKNLAKLYVSSVNNFDILAYDHLIRRGVLSQIKKLDEFESSSNIFIQDHATITHDQLDYFLHETKNFIHNLFQLLSILDPEGYLGEKLEWSHRLERMNQNLPTMFELNNTLKLLAETYRLGKISSKILNSEIEKLCKLPEISQI